MNVVSETQECPYCFTNIDAKATVCPNCQLRMEPVIQSQEDHEIKTKECPHCFTEIDTRATVCSTCSRDIEPSPAKNKGNRLVFQAMGGLIGMFIAVALITMIPVTNTLVAIGLDFTSGFVGARVGMSVYDSL